MGVAMSNAHKVSNQIRRNLSLRKPAVRKLMGFSLVELMVAMSVFLIVGGAAISLVRRHMPLFNSAQNQTNLNITLRNAVAQFQMEVVNAGTGFAGSTPTAFSPMGVTINKAANANCKATATYVAGCFDQFSLIAVDSTLPLLAPTDSTLIGTADTSKSPLFLINPAGGTPAQYAAWAALMPAGTELMFVQGGTDAPAGQPLISIVVVGSSGPVANANSIQIPLASTTQTVSCGGSTASGVPQVQDPLNIYDVAECGRFTGIFNPGLDYVVKLVAGATYSVDAANAANPKLVRTNATGTQDVIAEQVIGFTVGAWSSKTGNYSINPGSYGNDWASIRSLQVQLVARAAPNSDNPDTFRNVYDGGSYQVQAVSVVVNPRNLNTN
jgi:prepilin-type N-terminal cleavage/methylation domain-containing protein